MIKELRALEVQVVGEGVGGARHGEPTVVWPESSVLRLYGRPGQNLFRLLP